MRQILVDHARAGRSAKRGGDQYRVSLDQVNLASPERGIDLLALDEAMNRLAAFDERRARVLELRFFGGMTEEEAGEAIGISVATVRRELRLAQAWLYRELARPAQLP